MLETLYALAAAATVADFLLELGCKLYLLVKGRNARKRMVQEEVADTSENAAGPELQLRP